MRLAAATTEREASRASAIAAAEANTHARRGVASSAFERARAARAQQLELVGTQLRALAVDKLAEAHHHYTAGAVAALREEVTNLANMGEAETLARHRSRMDATRAAREAVLAKEYKEAWRATRAARERFTCARENFTLCVRQEMAELSGKACARLATANTTLQASQMVYLAARRTAFMQSLRLSCDTANGAFRTAQDTSLSTFGATLQAAQTTAVGHAKASLAIATTAIIQRSPAAMRTHLYEAAAHMPAPQKHLPVVAEAMAADRARAVARVRETRRLLGKTIEAATCERMQALAQTAELAMGDAWHRLNEAHARCLLQVRQLVEAASAKHASELSKLSLEGGEAECTTSKARADRQVYGPFRILCWVPGHRLSPLLWPIMPYPPYPPTFVCYR